MKKTIFLIFLLSFVQTAVVEAQSFIQSRYSGQPTVPECSGCDADFDGITHIRFDPASTALSSDDEGRNFITVKFQIRRQVFQTDTPIYISAAGFRLAYDRDVYGTQLADPVVPADDFSGDPRPQCSFDRSAYFTDPQAFGVGVYALRFLDSTPDQLNINEAHSQQAVAGVPPAAGFVALGEDWQDHITLTCEIPSGENNNDAGFAISGAQPRGIFFRNYPTGSPPAQVSTAVLLADNDIRGFRLDGKTWAKDYSRYGDGQGVRLEFSKGIRDALAIGNFTLDSTGDSSLISTVNHTPNSSIVEIEFSQAIENDILRLSTSTAVVDEDGGNLADGNFLAQLFYDAEAPQVTGFRRDSAFTTNTPNQSRWFLDFSHALTTPTVAGLCVTEDNGTCAAEGERASVNIVEVDVVATSTIAIVTRGMSAANRSIEFRRNAVLGADDYKVVEDYQPMLRGVLPESVPPTISVRWVDASGNPISNPGRATLTPPGTAAGRYTMYFRVTASEPVTDLGIAAAYGVSTIADLDSPTLVNNAATITVRPGASTTRTILEVTSEVASEVSDDGIEAFTLRALANFQDRVGNAAVRADDGSRINTGQPIDRRYSRAAAKRDNTSPRLAAPISDQSIVSTATEYTVTFSISVTNEDVVPTLNDSASYSLDIINRQGNVVDLSSFTPPARLSAANVMGSTTRAEITYMVTFNNEMEASTVTAFVLNRAAGQLLDLSFNQPANVQGTAIADGGQVAIVRTDDVPPQITGVSPAGIDSATGLDAYEITLDIVANEPIRIPENSIVPMSVIGNAPTLLTSGFELISSTDRDSENSVRYVFRITPPASAAARRAIRGYTLGTRVDTQISDRAGNLTAVISSGSSLFQGPLGNQIQLMDRDAPTLDVVAGAMNETDDYLAYSGSFTVSGPTGEFITNINTTASYRLLRVPFTNGAAGTAVPIPSGRISVGPVSDNSDSVILNFAGSFADIAEAQATFGFTIGLDPGASSRLSDPYGNLLNLDTGINNTVPDARALIDRVITVVADDMAMLPSEDNPNEYMGSFTVTADVGVPTIDTSSSYTLLRIHDDSTVSLIPADQVQINTSATQLNREVMVSFATSQNDITITRATQGFTLGVVSGALRNDLGTSPRAVGGRLDPRDAAVAERDTAGPQLTVMTSPAEDTSAEGASTISYNMSFMVSADETVRDIGSMASYRLLVVSSTTNEIPFEVTTMTVSAAGVNAMTATVDVDVSIGAEDEEAVEGFTLGYRLTAETELTLNDLAGNPPVNMSGDALADGDRLDESNQAEASTSLVMVECAAFYPNIGQRNLFVRVTSMSPVNVGGLTLMSGDLGLLATVEQVGTTQRGDRDEQISILRATLPEGDEFTESMISVSYLSSEPDAMPVEAECMASLTANIDEDSLIDIVDSTPFGGDAETARNTVASSEQIVDTPSELPNYYNRNVIIRSLLAGSAFESFTYVIADDENASTPMRVTFDSGMSNADYLGVDTSGNTRFFRVPEGEGSVCEEVLNTAYASSLGNVELSQFCGEIDGQADLTTAEVGSARYAWVDIGDDNRLQLSNRDEPIIYELAVLPDVNFSGQSSYLFASPTTKNVMISAFVGTSGGEANLSVGVYSYNDGYLDRGEDDRTLSQSNDSGVISAPYAIARHDGHPEPGETILYWLMGNSGVWSPDNTTLPESPESLPENGYDLSGRMYAVGVDNNIAIRVADATNEDEQITRIRQILLYEHSNSTLSRVTSMVANRAYVVVADIDTNVAADQINAEVAVQLMEEYEIDQSTANIVELRQLIRDASDLNNDKEDLAFIRLTVDDITETSLITVGWDSITGIPGMITADYLAFATEPAAYALVDADRDNIPDVIGGDGMPIDRSSGDATRLQVTIPGNTLNIHHVRAHDGNIEGQLRQLPMFLTHTGLAIADSQAGNGDPEAQHYSAANIKYDQIDENTRILLGIEDPNANTTAIYSIATFGVSDVEYGFTYDNAGMLTEILGGTIYVTFPIDNIGSVGETLYVGKYDNDNNRWLRFDTREMDTWYAIERRDPMLECPQDIETYRNGDAKTDDGGNGFGFTANMDNCIMLVITDGHPLHDESSRDGRVIDPLSIGPVQFDTADPGPSPRGRRGSSDNSIFGIGAIDFGDALFLLTALALLLVAGVVRRRRQLITPIS